MHSYQEQCSFVCRACTLYQRPVIEYGPSNLRATTSVAPTRAHSSQFSTHDAKHDSLTCRLNYSVVWKVDRFAEQMALLYAKMGQATGHSIKNDMHQSPCLSVEAHDLPTKMKLPHLRNAG